MWAGYPEPQDEMSETLLKIWYQLYNGNTGGGASNNGIAIPASDYVGYTYYGATNNIHTAVYKTGGSGGATVATLTFTYVGNGVSNDDNVSSVTKS